MMPELLKLFGLVTVLAIIIWAICYYVQWRMGWV
jgi:hypothetical protein